MNQWLMMRLSLMRLKMMKIREPRKSQKPLKNAKPSIRNNRLCCSLRPLRAKKNSKSSPSRSKFAMSAKKPKRHASQRIFFVRPSAGD